MRWLRKKSNRRVGQAEPRQWRRPLAIALSAALVVIALGTAGAYLRDIEWERFRALEVTGELEQVTVQEVQAVLQPYIAQGFASIDMSAARRSVEDLEWVASASLRRQWPGTLAVSLREERPVATWFGTALMNADGEVFVDGAAGFSGVLPDVGGPAGAQRTMVERLAEIRSRIQASGLDLRRLLRTERRAERFWVADGQGGDIEVRLGRRDVEARLDRFLSAAWPALQARAGQIAYVDMRYTNGFSVGWRTIRDGTPQQERG